MPEIWLMEKNYNPKKNKTMGLLDSIKKLFGTAQDKGEKFVEEANEVLHETAKKAESKFDEITKDMKADEIFEDMKEKAKEAKEEFMEQTKDVRNDVSEVVDKLKEKAKDVKEDLTEETADLRNKAGEVYKKASEKVSEIKDDISEAIDKDKEELENDDKEITEEE